MKKNKLLATAMTSIIMTGTLSGCANEIYDPHKNIEEQMYGPPPMSSERVVPYRPSDNRMQPAYGPPPTSESNIPPEVRSSAHPDSDEENEVIGENTDE